MPSTKAKKPVLQLTISLTEVTQLQTENAALKKQVAELQAENEALKVQVKNLTKPKKPLSVPLYKPHDPGIGL